MCESQKHLGVILDKHLNFHEHIDKKNKICNKMIGTISVHLPRKSLFRKYNFLFHHNLIIVITII